MNTKKNRRAVRRRLWTVRSRLSGYPQFSFETLSLPFKEDASGYLHTGEFDGLRYFALWPLAQAAESCFGTGQWPENTPYFAAAGNSR